MTNCIFQRCCDSLTPHATSSRNLNLENGQPRTASTSRIQQKWHCDCLFRWLPRLGYKRLCSNPCLQKHTWIPDHSITSPATLRPPCWRGHTAVLWPTAQLRSSDSVNCQTCQWASGMCGPAKSSSDCNSSHSWTAAIWEHLSENCLAKPFPNSWSAKS